MYLSGTFLFFHSILARSQAPGALRKIHALMKPNAHQNVRKRVRIVPELTDVCPRGPNGIKLSGIQRWTVPYLKGPRGTGHRSWTLSRELWKLQNPPTSPDGRVGVLLRFSYFTFSHSHIRILTFSYSHIWYSGASLTGRLRSTTNQICLKRNLSHWCHTLICFTY